MINTLVTLMLGICLGIIIGFELRGLIFRRIYKHYQEKGTIVKTDVMQGTLLLFKHDKEDDDTDGTGQET